MNNENQRCCVCLEGEVLEYKCDYCVEGIMCYNCYGKNWVYCEKAFMRNKVQHRDYLYECDIEMKHKKLLTEIIKCPCCRSINWRKVYKSIFEFILESDCDNEFYFKKNTSNNITKFKQDLTYWFDTKNYDEDDDEEIEEEEIHFQRKSN